VRTRKVTTTFLSHCVLALVVSELVPAAVGTGAPRSPSTATTPLAQAEAYYRNRSDLDNVRKAISILQAAVGHNPREYEAWWRMAEYDAYLARHVSRQEQKRILNRGIQAASQAEHLVPNRPEGHYWEGADEGLLAEDSGLIGGLRYIGPVRQEMETVLKIDPSYQEYGAERILGRLYSEAPFFMGGDKAHSIKLLKDCLRHYPKNSLTLLYLADAYREDGQRSEARKTLEEILTLPPDPNYGPEQEYNQSAARQELKKYFHVK
jgi:tetratricopeptide (TPR) repeat protein